eukprot:5961703-Pyramimonas_sp.AAC.1
MLAHPIKGIVPNRDLHRCAQLGRRDFHGRSRARPRTEGCAERRGRNQLPPCSRFRALNICSP